MGIRGEQDVFLAVAIREVVIDTILKDTRKGRRAFYKLFSKGKGARKSEPVCWENSKQFQTGKYESGLRVWQQNKKGISG